jgi:hypothetical protein
MSAIDINWAPCDTDFPKYFPFFCDEQQSPAPKTLSGITSLTFKHTAFVGTGGVYIYDTANLQSISFPNLASIESIEGNSGFFVSPLFQIYFNDYLTSVDLPSLSLLGGFKSCYMWIFSCPLLTNINMPLFTLGSVQNCELKFNGNALTQPVVDSILARVDASPVPTVAKTLRLDGGTNAAPSVAGLVSRASLIGKGWTVTTN